MINFWFSAFIRYKCHSYQSMNFHVLFYAITIQPHIFISSIRDITGNDFVRFHRFDFSVMANQISIRVYSWYKRNSFPRCESFHEKLHLTYFFGGSCGTRTRKTFGYEPNALTNCAKDPCCSAFHAAVRLSGLSENYNEKQWPRLGWSAWRGSNPHSQLGKLICCHYNTSAYLAGLSPREVMPRTNHR